MTLVELRSRYRLSRTALAVCLLASGTSALAQADRNEARTQSAAQTQSATNSQAATNTQPGSRMAKLRSDDGMLSVEAAFPSQVRMDEQFQYQVTLTNNTENMVLHDIRLNHQGSKGLMIESVKVTNTARGTLPAESNRPANSSQPAEASQPTDPENAQSAPNENKSEASQQQSESPTDNQNKSQNQSEEQALNIDRLGPGESKTFTVLASASQEGEVDACLVIASYKPAICLRTEVVKPDLSIAKTAPERANQCDVIELTYTVRNQGSGDIAQFEIIDELADGLMTIDGKNRLAFSVDELRAGDTRQFVASVFATRTGEFKSRATAQATQSELKARSQNVGPTVVGADLQVQVQGPNSVYSSRPALFTATITNTGNAVAEAVQVQVSWPEEARLVNISPVLLDGEEQPDTDGSDDETRDQQPTPEAAKAQDTNPSQNQNQPQGENQNANVQPSNQNGSTQQTANPNDRQQMAMAQQQLNIARLEPGQKAVFSYTVSARRTDLIPTKVDAVYVCSVAEAHQNVDAESRKTAQAMARVNVIRLPALQIYTVDSNDPVASNKPVTYTIRVKNEGDAIDKQVQVTAVLPEQLEFQSAQGPTEFERQNKRIVFQPIEELEAGAEAEYTLTASVAGQGNVSFQVELDSQSLSSTVKVAEPTQLFNPQAAANATSDE